MCVRTQVRKIQKIANSQWISSALLGLPFLGARLFLSLLRVCRFPSFTYAHTTKFARYLREI